MTADRAARRPASRDSSRSSPRACCRSCRAISRPSPPSRRTGSASAGRRGGSCSRASRSCSASRPSSSPSASARSSSAPASSATSSCSSGWPGSSSSSSGFAFMGLLPWPERLVGAGLVQGARSRGSRVLLGGAFAICAAPCIGPVLAAILVLAGTSDTVLQGAFLLAVLLARARDPVRARGCDLHAGDGGVPLAPGSLRRDPVRQRRDHGRPRPAALLRPLLHPADLSQPRARAGRDRRLLLASELGARCAGEAAASSSAAA